MRKLRPREGTRSQKDHCSSLVIFLAIFLSFSMRSNFRCRKKVIKKLKEFPWVAFPQLPKTLTFLYNGTFVKKRRHYTLNNAIYKMIFNAISRVIVENIMAFSSIPRANLGFCIAVIHYICFFHSVMGSLSLSFMAMELKVLDR